MNNPLNPNVPKHHYALIQVEVRTGIILTVSGERYTGKGERFLIFEQLERANHKAREIVRGNPEIECVIQDDQNDEVATIRDETYVQELLTMPQKRKRLW